MAKVIGLGGVFVKLNDPDAMRVWYHDVLGITTNDYGVLFEFGGKNSAKGYLQLGTFQKDTGYFGESGQHYMLNFRVDNLDELIVTLKQNDVKILDEIESYSYGRFIHIEDPEGNKIELWEPVDEDFEENEKSTMPSL